MLLNTFYVYSTGNVNHTRVSPNYANYAWYVKGVKDFGKLHCSVGTKIHINYSSEIVLPALTQG